MGSDPLAPGHPDLVASNSLWIPQESTSRFSNNKGSSFLVNRPTEKHTTSLITWSTSVEDLKSDSLYFCATTSPWCSLKRPSLAALGFVWTPGLQNIQGHSSNILPLLLLLARRCFFLGRFLPDCQTKSCRFQPWSFCKTWSIMGSMECFTIKKKPWSLLGASPHVTAWKNFATGTQQAKQGARRFDFVTFLKDSHTANDSLDLPAASFWTLHQSQLLRSQ